MAQSPRTVIRKLKEAYFGDDPDEAGVMSRLSGHLVECVGFVDIGASLGQYTKLAAEHMREGIIWACEPDILRFVCLLDSAHEWETDNGPRILCLPVAISDKAGLADFYGPGSLVSGSLVKAPDVIVRKVPTLRLPPVLEHMPGPLIIKIDTEGSEVDILRDSHDVLMRKDVQWLIEIHPQAYNEQAVQDLMRSYGYTGREFGETNRMWFTRR